jgi:hypothetical protein
MRSPAFNWVPAQQVATRLIASVAPRTNTISSGDPAPMNRATARRAASYATVMSAERWYTPRCTVA